MSKTVGCGCDYCMGRGPRRDFRHGGVPLSDFDEEAPYKKKSKKKRPAKKRGCPENDYGPHVYVWVPTSQVYDWWPDYDDGFYEKHGFHRREHKICCGCGKKQGGRYTEEMQKRIAKLGWYKAMYGD